MSKGVKIAIGLFLGFLLLVVSIAGFLWSAKVQAGKMENGIIAIYEDMQNVYANSIIQTLEAKGKVTKQYKEDLIEVVKANMLRYQNDQQLMFKAVAESANLTLTPDLYKDLSKSVEVGYKTFESSQRSKIDRVRAFKDYLDNSIKGQVSKIFGYPTEKVKFIMEQLITNPNTTKTFATGKMEQVDIFGKEKEKIKE